MPLIESTTNKSKEIRRSLANQIWQSLKERWGLNLTENSQANLQNLNQLLKTNPAVIYINHTSIKDAPLAISMVLSQLPNAQHILGPVGMKHHDFKRDPLSAAAFRLLKLINIEALPVVQTDDLTNYGPKQQLMINQLKKMTSNLLRQPGSVYGIAPEGTRSKNGVLQKANKGIGHLVKYNPDLFYLPVAFLYPQFTPQPQIAVGEPLQLPQIIPNNLILPNDSKEKAQLIADFHMIRLAQLMPQNLRGIYLP